jgi:hypothetical protein
LQKILNFFSFTITPTRIIKKYHWSHTSLHNFIHFMFRQVFPALAGAGDTFGAAAIAAYAHAAAAVVGIAAVTSYRSGRSLSSPARWHKITKDRDAEATACNMATRHLMVQALHLIIEPTHRRQSLKPNFLHTYLEGRQQQHKLHKVIEAPPKDINAQRMHDPRCSIQPRTNLFSFKKDFF